MITTAWAQDAASTAAGGSQIIGLMFSYLPLILIFAIFYMLIIRPQNKAAKEHAAMLAALKRGDAVQTQGGLLGTVDAVKDRAVQLRLAPGVVVTLAKAAIVRIVEAEEAKLVNTGDGVVVDVTAKTKKK